MSNTLAKVGVRTLEAGELFEGRYPGDTGTANRYEEPVNWARIAVLIAAALPVFGGLYYLLLNFLLFGWRLELPTLAETVIAFLTLMSALADQAFLLVLITACLGACIVRAFWEIEQSRERRRQQSRNAVQPTWRRGV